MAPLNLLLLGAGIVLIVAGYLRARGPWSRYQGLRSEAANAERYGAWRGGVRDEGTTGASVAMDMLRRQALMGVAVAVVGGVMVFLGFLIR